MRQIRRPEYEALRKRLTEWNLAEEDPFMVRLDRALSWYKRACKETSDHAKYVFLWIAFNAAYGVEEDAYHRDRGEGRTVGGGEFDTICRYFRNVTSLDREGICEAIGKVRSPVYDIADNRFIFRKFWRSDDERDAREEYKSSVSAVDELIRYADHGALDRDQLQSFLQRIFDRLYTLRNQLMHGAATLDEDLSKRQVESGVRILEALLPIFLAIMIDDRDKNRWGSVPYPRSDEIRERWRARRP